MKKILLSLILLLSFFFAACSSDNDNEEKSWAQKQSEFQEEMYNRIENSIIGHWYEYMYRGGMTGKWNLSSEKPSSLIEDYTFNSDGKCQYKNIIEKTGRYIIKKNPDYVNENKIVSGPHCCIIIEIKLENGSRDNYSALLDDDGTLKLAKVFNLLGDFREPEYNEIFKKQ